MRLGGKQRLGVGNYMPAPSSKLTNHHWREDSRAHPSCVRLPNQTVDAGWKDVGKYAERIQQRMRLSDVQKEKGWTPRKVKGFCCSGLQSKSVGNTLKCLIQKLNQQQSWGICERRVSLLE